MRKRKIKVVCVSDSHRQHRKMTDDIPEGDILLFAGDAELDTFEALKDFNDWLGHLKFTHRVVIAGNHDFFTQRCPKEELDLFFTNAIYLQNTSVKLFGINIFGGPYSPTFNKWAWMLNSDRLQQIWELIPKNTNILLTHCPPYGILDHTPFSKWSCGCPHLLKKIEDLKIPYHCFGHIHNDSSVYVKKDTTFINASMLDDYYQYVNKPKVFYYEK